MEQLIRQTILPRLGDQTGQLSDSAELNLDSPRICFTTDSYVVKPLFFNGGDIGKLAVCGTINDLAVAGSKPVAIALSLIIESGLEITLLEKILDSAAAAAKENDVKIVTGDTKTVEAGAAEGLYINTAGVGVRCYDAQLGFERVDDGDKIIISGTIGDHGITIISQREGMKFETPLASDCASVWPLTNELLKNCPGIKFMRDPTRGGLAATLNEIGKAAHASIEINEADIPVHPTVQAAADMLGFDVLNIANEGKVVIIVEPDNAEKCLAVCRNNKLGAAASIIGQVRSAERRHLVQMKTRIGGTRIVQMPYGAELPRIC